MNDIEQLTTISESENITNDIKIILHKSRTLTARTINTTMVTTYWLIGRRIVKEEQRDSKRAAYGEKLLKSLSKELTEEFGNGFSYANLKNMRQYYKTYPDQIGYTLSSQLSWSHRQTAWDR